MSFLSRLFGQPPAASTARPTTELSAAPSATDAQILTGVATNVGCVREINEDMIRIVRPEATGSSSHLGIMVAVCDGMGGHEGGEVASRLAMEALVTSLGAPEPDGHTQLVRATEAANHAVFAAADSEPRLKGMGTTCTTMLIRQGLAYCAHVGDSRCYMLRDGDLFLMTEDHSAVMELVRKGVITRDEARNHPDKNVISRALGSHRRVEVTRWPQAMHVRTGDRFVLCSDGLYDLVTDDVIRDTVRSLDPQAACDRLIELARAGGGFDNISVAVVQIASTPAGNMRATRVPEDAA
jgi:protein phosphatase